MSYNPRTLGAPTSYTRQTSFEEDGPSSSSSAARYGGLPSSSSSNVNRRPTVRGAVRGTIREAGVNPRLSMGVVVPGRTLTRGKTLTRPDRFVAPAPLINPGLAPGGHNKSGGAVQTKLVDGKPTLITSEPWWEPWGLFVEVSTWWAPRWLLRRMGMTDPIKQRAWKEKCALCTVSAMLMAIVGFITIGLNRTLCPSDATSRFTRLGSDSGFVGIHGWAFDVAVTTPSALLNPSNTKGGMDVTGLFDLSSLPFPGCDGITAAYATTNLCTGTDLTTANATCSYTAPASSLYSTLSITNTTKQVGYDWDQLSNLTHYLVLDGNVLNLTPYMLAHPTPIANDTVDTAIRFMLEEYNGSGGRDATRIFNNEQALRSSIKCLEQRYYAGHLDKITPGCFVSNLFLYVSLGLIMTIVLARFVMACIYSWYLSHKLVAPPKNLKRQVISPAVMPEGANIDVDNTTGAAPWTNQEVQRRATQRLKKGETRRAGGGGGARGAGQVVAEKEKEYLEKPMGGGGGGGGGGRQGPEALDTEGMINMASIGAELFCVCLVTCYSEGAEGIRSTLDSIAGTTYSDARKLIFIVCDGMITGDGETASTPDICVGMLEADPRFGEPQAMSYLSIGHGAKAHNQAMVYAGHYTNAAGHRTPTIIVVKCGPPEEAKEKKPGNRGKRDSQMILMNFFSRVTYNDRMSPLDYDLFRKTQSLMGVTPDFFEVCLMVDADTKVYPDSLGYLVRTMQNDNMIMGVCGETRIANKRQSWVTMIQVFEYFISHHQSKAFESVFGGVTCLPGCFSMYRLKARKEDDGDWFPVLVQPQIVSEYSQSVVTTLHQKNLLLLGEDRFLTTLLLRTFPNRKMMFCPQARCRTIAPDTFAVLLSQRRRWINSTVHNLMELVLVRNLCGTFCFSMQFVVMVDLIGTVVLPIAICLTGILIISAIITPPNSFSDAIPLLLLGAVLGLPGVLILISTFKIVYIGWMFIYLLALPIWNFVLPLYSFSKFDDFSWGETRKVAGEVKGDDGHGAMGGEVANVPLRRWEDWERSRLRKMKRDERRRRDFERQFGSRQTYQSSNSLWDDSTAHSETASSYGGDEDRWGMEIGQYSEDGPTLAPPPIGLFHIDADSSEGDHETIAEHELELVLDQGWQEDDSPHGRPYGSGYASPRPMSPQVPPTLYALSDAPVMQKTWSSNSHEPLNQSASSSVEQFAAQDPFNNTNYVSNYGCTSPIASPIPSPYQQQHAQMLPAGASSGVEGSGAYGHVKNRSLSSTNSSPVIARGGREASGGAETPSPTREQYGQGRRIA